MPAAVAQWGEHSTTVHEIEGSNLAADVHCEKMAEKGRILKSFCLLISKFLELLVE